MEDAGDKEAAKPVGAEEAQVLDQLTSAEREASMKAGLTKYRDNPLEAFRNGALFDFRVRVAIELLAHGGVFEAVVLEQRSLQRGFLHQSDVAEMPKRAAAVALDAASELVRLAEERGLVDPFPDPETMSKGLKDHVVRQVVFQAYATEQQQKRAKAVSGPIMPGFAGPRAPFS